MNAVIPSISEGSEAATVATAPLSAPIIVNPLEQLQWDTQLAALPEATLFHDTAWARVLSETYGHRPVYFCRYAGGQLQQVLPVMEVSSALTGRRGFHCRSRIFVRRSMEAWKI